MDNININKAKMLSLLCSKTYENKPWQTPNKFTSFFQNKQTIRPTDSTLPLFALSGILNEELIIAFRGTVTVNIANKEQSSKLWREMLLNIISNLLAVADSSHYTTYYNRNAYEGMVHPGFALLLENFLPDIQDIIINSNAKQVCLTGHSLGGALATLAAYRLINDFPITSVYTFGSPRVGDYDFKIQYNKYKITHFRFENKNDIVPHLPPYKYHRDYINNFIRSFVSLQLPAINYQHVGTLEFINWEGYLVKDSRQLEDERLAKFSKNIKQILHDHDINSYYQSLETLKNVGVDMENSLNILIIGKCGSGKSSLINYLYGSNIAKTGIGSPVTQNGFDKYKIKWENIDVEIYDSVGLEVGVNKSEEWRKELNNELKNHGIERPASQWFHTIFYCINAGGHRFEEYECEIIKQLITDKYRVVVVVTNADTIEDSEIPKLVSPIRKIFNHDILPIIPVCNVDRKVREYIIRTFGRPELEAETLKGFWFAITLRLPERCEYLLLQQVKKWEDDQKDIVKSNSDDKNGSKKLRISQRELANIINDNFTKFREELETIRSKTISHEVERTISNFQVIANKLQYPQPEDFPPFPNEPIIMLPFVEQLKNVLVDQFNNVFVNFVVYISDLTGNKDAQPIVRQLEDKMQELKSLIEEQKPKIIDLIKHMIRENASKF